MTHQADRDTPSSRSGQASYRTGHGKSRGLSRPLLIGVGLVVLGAAFLFWPKGGDSPTPKGERTALITSAGDLGGDKGGALPRSGEVSDPGKRSALVPEKYSQGDKAVADAQDAAAEQLLQPAQTGTKREMVQEPAVTQPVKAEKPVAKPKSSTTTKPRSSTPTKTATPPAPRITPSAQGAWAVQVGAYSQESNANNLVQKLADAGYPAKVYTVSTSSGGLLFRVRVGYFASRDDAVTYARQNKAKLGQCDAVHR